MQKTRSYASNIEKNTGAENYTVEITYFFLNKIRLS